MDGGVLSGGEGEIASRREAAEGNAGGIDGEGGVGEGGGDEGDDVVDGGGEGVGGREGVGEGDYEEVLAGEGCALD